MSVNVYLQVANKLQHYSEAVEVWILYTGVAVVGVKEVIRQRQTILLGVSMNFYCVWFS